MAKEASLQGKRGTESRDVAQTADLEAVAASAAEVRRKCSNCHRLKAMPTLQEIQTLLCVVSKSVS